MKKNSLFFLAIVLVSTGSSQNLVGKIIFSHFNKAMLTDTIYAMDNNGQNLTFVTEGWDPRLSHNGKYLAFSKGANPNSSYGANLWIRDLTALHDTLIVSNSDYLNYYDFSPDDQQITYSQSCSIYRVNIDGSAAYTYVGCNPCDCFSDDPTIRLGDSALVYHNLHYGIYTSNYDGSTSQIVPHTYPGDLVPIWSPDGQWIAYEKTDPAVTYYRNVNKIKPDGSDSTTLSFLALTDSLTPDPVWASDMQSLFVIGRINNQLGFYRISTDGSGTYTLLRPWSGDGSVFDFWLGLADSISSIPLSTQNISAPASQLFITPNPASSQTTLQISLQQSLDVMVELFDMTGRKVETIFSGDLSTGSHSVRIDVKSFHSGTYIVRMKTPNASVKQKLIVVK